MKESHFLQQSNTMIEVLIEWKGDDSRTGYLLKRKSIGNVTRKLSPGEILPEII